MLLNPRFMHTEQAKLGDLFIPFEQDLRRVGISLVDLDGL